MPPRRFLARRLPLCALGAALCAGLSAGGASVSAQSAPASHPTLQQPDTSKPAADQAAKDQAGKDQAAQSSGGPITTLSLGANLVNLPVIVRDKKGAIVQNLTKDDFTLVVDNKPQTIRYFDKDNNLPLTLGLLVDISGSVRNMLDDERTASSSFLDSMLQPAQKSPEKAADRAFVMQFARESELLQDVTASKPKLQAALREIGSSNPNSNSSNDPNDTSGNNNGGRGRRGGTTLYDAVFLSSDELMSKQKGRKAIILLTDGVDSGSKESMNSAIEAAQRADTIIYAIYFKGQEGGGGQQQNPGMGRRGGGFPGYPGGGGGYPGGGYPGGGGGYPGGRGGGGGQQQSRPDGKKILERMAGETGGRVFEESRKQDFDAIYKEIADELRSQYRIGFTPDKDILEDGYHRVDLDLPKQKNLKIQTRDGYYTGKP